jgi:hypothetical protein
VISYQRALRVLQPIIEPVCHGLRAGMAEAVRYHADQELDRTHDQHFFSHNARRIAWERLREDNLPASIDEGGNKMSSLVVPYQGLVVRILRGPRGRQIGDLPRSLSVPGPGPSEPWRRFWRQEAEQPLPGMVINNLLWVWGDDDGVLTEPMILARPTGSLNNYETTRLSWQGKISEAMASMRAEDLDELEPDVITDELGS